MESILICFIHLRFHYRVEVISLKGRSEIDEKVGLSQRVLR